MEKAKEILGYIAAGLVVFTFGIPVIPIAGASIYDHYHKDTVVAEPTCSNTPLPYETRKIDSPAYDVGEEHIDTYGIEGKKTTCMKDGVVTATSVTDPTDEIVLVGTHKELEVERTRSSCPITTCNDGWCSRSTGRGTCSWHGGVAY